MACQYNFSIFGQTQLTLNPFEKVCGFMKMFLFEIITHPRATYTATVDVHVHVRASLNASEDCLEQ